MKIVELPEVVLAVLRFSGSWDSERLAGREDELIRALEASTWFPVNTPSALFYDPPWTLPIFRRNEVVVPVER